MEGSSGSFEVDESDSEDETESEKPQTADGCRWMELQRCYSGAIGGAIGGAAQPLNWAMTSKLTATAATACRWMLHHRTPSDNQQTVGLTPTAH
ncbi:GD10826 [Drosophila simulans]|uniref:GD10826 n=1 Tax=Drosophila simulans TaxID=7240 RepID=B4QC52_DROSI|nr:GD10826 [Drosophila simulans]